MAEEARGLCLTQIETHGRLSRFIINTKKLKLAEWTAIEYEDRLTLLESIWSRFYENHQVLCKYIQSLQEDDYFKLDIHSESEQAYVTARSWLRRQVLSFPMPNPRHQVQVPLSPSYLPRPDHSHLKPIPIPKFTGKQSEWVSFKERFQALVLDDATIPDVIKLERLIAQLEGDALGQYREVEITGQNLDTVWSSLNQRFDNFHIRLSLAVRAITQIPEATKETEEHLNLMSSVLAQSTSTFLNLKLDIKTWDPILIALMEDKLSSFTHALWIERLADQHPNSSAPLSEFKDFLQRRLRARDRLEVKLPPPIPAPRAKPSQKRVNLASSRTQTCRICQGEHATYSCPTFHQATLSERCHWVLEHQLCFNCLSPNHALDRCKSTGRCAHCQKMHHTLLHPSTPAASDNRASDTKPTGSGATSSVLHVSKESDSKILLSTAMVILEAESGQRITVRALIDTGAEVSLVSGRVCQLLGLTKEQVAEKITGSGGTVNTIARHRVHLLLRSVTNPRFRLPIAALVLKRVTQPLPQFTVKQHWPHLKGLSFSDPTFWHPGRIDCILNAAVFGDVLLPEVRRDRSLSDSPVAFNTELGWILVGRATAELSLQVRPTGRTESISRVHFTATSPDLQLSVERFWELDEVPTSTQLTPEEKACSEHFAKTHYRDSSGRFVVRLPSKDNPELVGTRDIAENCFRHLERRLHRQPQTSALYTEFINEYQRLGHLSPIDQHSSTLMVGYLPHHPVCKSEGKLRVVFNASRPDKRGRSLNSLLHTGPKLQLDIITVLLRWSMHRFAFTCDIVKMFRQFLVNPLDRDWQRILWRQRANEPLVSLRLNTVTYGTACAPYLANACLLQLADEGQEQFPLAATAIRESRYVDDFFIGGNSLNSVEETRNQLCQLLRTAGMDLDRWAFNWKPGQSEKDSESVVIESESEPEVPLLGLRWDPAKDLFQYRAHHVSTSGAVTRRTILAEIARLYDPCGWIAPIIIGAKIFIQSLWLLKIGWDAPVPPAAQSEWQHFRSQLADVELLQIPRWVLTNPHSPYVLHGFCDASQRAFAACVYVTTEHQGKLTSRLLVAKSRVAPIKKLQLPRLELCGAVLLSNLLRYVISSLPLKPKELHCWSDSTVALAWIQGPPARWQTFVANRVSLILTNIPEAQWHFINGTENPADPASRGVWPADLKDNILWWQGPTWLNQEPMAHHLIAPIQWDTDEESRPVDLKIVAHSKLEPSEDSWIRSFSSVDRLIIAAGYWLKWKAIARHQRDGPPSSHLSAKERREGLQRLVWLEQRRTYSHDIDSLKTSNQVLKVSPLSPLLPFLDPVGLLRVGGRLHHADLSPEEKHPLILSRECHLASLLVRQAHIITLHGGPNLIHGLISRRYWIVHGRNLVRKYVRSCVTCLRYQGRTLQPLMAPLPAVRVQPSRPFSSVGVDYAGPFLIKSTSGRGIRTSKGYVAIFICLVTKAVHLELASDYTTKVFLAAFRRFIARRGMCHTIISDHGTNFQGAHNQLRRLFQQSSVMGREVTSALAREGIEWKYIPPRSPHFGGIWEANIKSFKRHLRKSVGDRKLTFEEFSTILTHIEACLNSRPLYATSSSASDPVAITPGHFLIGAPLLALPDTPESPESLDLTTRWRGLEDIRQSFWRRWYREVLSQMQSRPKWQRSNVDLKVGDVVILKDELLPATRWPLARIVRLHTGPDGHDRVATIKTATSEIVRSLTRLIKLPTDSSSPS